MGAVFLSYSRDSAALAEALVADIKELGHSVWFDRDLSGGQAWWSKILAAVRECDVFVFALTPQSLDSMACQREYGYAAALRKRILPVLLADGISTNLLPAALAQIQFVDYRSHDRAAALRLARGIAALSSPEPLPDPLPAPPEVPMSYLSGLAERLATTPALSYEEQSTLVFDLRRSLRDPQTAADSRALLEQLRRRRDLLAPIGEAIEEILTTAKEVPIATTAPASPSTAAEPAPRASIAWRKRIAGGAAGALLALLVGAATLVVSQTREGGLWIYVMLGGVIAAAIGAIVVGNRLLTLVALTGAVAISVALSLMDRGADAIAVGVVLGAPLGAIVGTILAAIYATLRKPG